MLLSLIALVAMAALLLNAFETKGNLGMVSISLGAVEASVWRSDRLMPGGIVVGFSYYI